MLELCLITQILNGLFLAVHYTPAEPLFRSRLNYICRGVNSADEGFIYYGSYLFTRTRLIGVVVLFLGIAAAFIGYVLPNIFSTNYILIIPYLIGDPDHFISPKSIVTAPHIQSE
uniref:Uncharacterized protein n=1 Tax=Glossina morsitans morsitans TaxID=37546 RepID=A0A1B0FFD4_GLOMM